MNISQSRRRFIVVGFVSTFLTSLTLRLFVNDLAGTAVALQVIGMAFLVLLLRWAKPFVKNRSVDERQREVRNRTYFGAYLLLSAVVFSVPVLVTLLFVIHEQTARVLITTLLASLQRPVDFVWVFGLLTPFLVFLPLAMLAWLEPDPPAEEVRVTSVT